LIVSFAGGLRLNRTAPVAARGVFASLVPELTIVHNAETGDWVSKGSVPTGYWTSLQFIADFIAGLEQLNFKLISVSGYEGEGRTYIFKRHKM
jgi:hypothetical protein